MLSVVPLQVKEIQSQAVLFEVNVPDFPLITKCRNENKMLKMLWDYIFLVRWGPCNTSSQPNCACKTSIPERKILVIPTSRKNFNQQPNRAYRTSIDEWKTTPWCNIDVENMDIDCKKFSKVKRGRCTIIINNRLQKVLKGEKRRSSNLFFHQDLRSLDKSMRDWHAYKGLETTVKNTFG